MQKTPGEKVKPKYTLKVGNLPNGNKEYFKVDESGKVENKPAGPHLMRERFKKLANIVKWEKNLLK